MKKIMSLVLFMILINTVNNAQTKTSSKSNSNKSLYKTNKSEFTVFPTNLLTSNINQLKIMLQGEHQLSNNGGWILFEGNNFKLGVTWKQRDRMLGGFGGSSGSEYYSTTASIKGQYNIEEYISSKEFNTAQTNKYGEQTGINKRGINVKYRINFSGIDNVGKAYTFCRMVVQTYNKGELDKWYLSAGINDGSGGACNDGTNNIDFNFPFEKYLLGEAIKETNEIKYTPKETIGTWKVESTQEAEDLKLRKDLTTNLYKPNIESNTINQFSQNNINDWLVKIKREKTNWFDDENKENIRSFLVF